MTPSKFLSFLFLFLISISLSYSATYNQEGDFTVVVDSQKDSVFNDNIISEFVFTIINNEAFDQDFKINLNPQGGWDIETPFESFRLDPNTEQVVKIKFAANSDFDYSANVVSPDTIVIAQKDEYIGFFNFPITISGENENVSLKYSIAIERKEDLEIEFESKISPVKISPNSPLKYTINALHITENVDAVITIKIGDIVLQEYTEPFTEKINYKILIANIPTDINPGLYDVIITTRVQDSGSSSAKEWFTQEKLEVVPYKFITQEETYENSILKDSTHILLINEGNVKDVYTKVLDVPLLSNFIFTATVDGEEIESVETEDGDKFEISLEKGESKEFEYSFNYLALYIIIIVLVIIAIYIYIRKTSNPLDAETKIYEIKRIEHEGVKSLKVSLGFENIKEKEIDDLRIIFRMPTYLQVKDGSFTLTEPKHVLKGRAQFKLLWDFKRFEKDDARIIGFSLVNKKGILGDIKIPDLEIEVKVDGKVRKYFHSFPVIKG